VSAAATRLFKVDYLMGGNKGERHRKNSLHQARTGISHPMASYTRIQEICDIKWCLLEKKYFMD
jgi:hypothetical protein